MKIIVEIDVTPEEEGTIINRGFTLADQLRDLGASSAEMHTQSIGVVDLLQPDQSEAIVQAQIEDVPEPPTNPSNSAYVQGEGGQVLVTPSAPASQILVDPNKPAMEEGAQAAGPVIGEHREDAQPAAQPANETASTDPGAGPDSGTAPNTPAPQGGVDEVPSGPTEDHTLSPSTEAWGQLDKDSTATTQQEPAGSEADKAGVEGASATNTTAQPEPGVVETPPAG